MLGNIVSGVQLAGRRVTVLVLHIRISLQCQGLHGLSNSLLLLESSASVSIIVPTKDSLSCE